MIDGRWSNAHRKTIITPGIDHRPPVTITEFNDIRQMRSAFKKNWKLYLMEALGLGIFMISACFFDGMLEAKNSAWHTAIPDPFIRLVIMGVMMGLTALFIFYSPVTAPSGAHINPAVTLTFLYLERTGMYDALFYIIFQFAGGTLAVYMMASLMGHTLTGQPVNYAVTVPGKDGVGAACIIECCIAFVMMSMILFTSASKSLSKYSKLFAACLVCINVLVAGSISGFGMNPARSFASALPAHTWTAFWIYLFVPPVSMLAAAVFFLAITHRKKP